MGSVARWPFSCPAQGALDVVDMLEGQLWGALGRVQVIARPLVGAATHTAARPLAGIALVAGVCGASTTVERLEIGVDHDADELIERGLVGPADGLARLRRVAQQKVDLGGAEVGRIDLDERAAVLL